MTTTIVLQQAINGVVLGSLYVLVALGLTLIYGVLVQINFAHADFVTLGAFAAYFLMHLVGAGYIVSIGFAFLVGAVLGWLINASIFTPLRRKGNELLPLIATIGVSVMMQNLMLAWFGRLGAKLASSRASASVCSRRPSLSSTRAKKFRGIQSALEM